MAGSCIETAFVQSIFRRENVSLAEYVDDVSTR